MTLRGWHKYIYSISFLMVLIHSVSSVKSEYYILKFSRTASLVLEQYSKTIQSVNYVYDILLHRILINILCNNFISIIYCFIRLLYFILIINMSKDLYVYKVYL